MATIQVKKLPGKTKNARQLLAELCYYYPQYTYAEARLLPAKDVSLLLSTAQKIKAAEMFELTNIAAAPHTKKGEGVKQLLQKYKDKSR